MTVEPEAYAGSLSGVQSLPGSANVAPPNAVALNWVHLASAYLTTNFVAALEVVSPRLTKECVTLDLLILSR